MPTWSLNLYGDVRLHPMRARIGRWLRAFLAAAEADDEWLDRQAQRRLARAEKPDGRLL